MPAQMSHVNKLLAVHKQQQKKAVILVLFLAHEFTQDISLEYFQRRESLFCQEITIYHSKKLKIK